MMIAALIVTLVAQAAPPLPSGGPTPGSTALLVDRDPAQARSVLQQALRHSDPAVRMIAARVVGNAPFRGMSAELLSALAVERDPAVAAEDVRDVLLTDASGESAIEPQLHRIGAGAALAYAEWLGRTQPEGLAQKIADLFALAPDAGFAFTRIVRMSGALHPDARDQVYRAWLKVAPQSAWRSLLYQAFSGSAAGPADVLVSALQSDRADIRTETVWFVVGRSQIPDVVVDAALPPTGAATVDWELYGRELIARHYKHIETPDRAEFLKSALGHAVFGALNLRRNPDVSAAEKMVLETVPAAGMGELDPWFPESAITASSIAGGEIASLLAASNCEPKSDSTGAAVITYAMDGRPQKIELSNLGLSPACQVALTTFARLNSEEPSHAANEGTQMLVLPFDKDAFGCIDEAFEGRTQYVPPPRVDGHRVTEPTIVREPTKVYYPPDAQRQRIQGTVIMEVIVSSRGCVQHASVLRGVYPSVDAAALNRIMRTEFTPPTVDGKPSPILMTRTINFALTK
ncbi:MAG: energy transducer TonB [Vicinamibacterales bacterium]